MFIDSSDFYSNSKGYLDIAKEGLACSTAGLLIVIYSKMNLAITKTPGKTRAEPYHSGSAGVLTLCFGLSRRPIGRN
jgi:hypothetical protein